MRVLLVSDNPRVAMKVTTALLGDDAADTDVVQVATPQRGVALLDAGERFTVVVGDNDTAPSGGFFLAREIKSRGQMGQDMPPVVLLIAREQDVFLSNWSQADAYVVKPIDPFDLRATIDAVVKGEPLPALPGVGGNPTASLLDIPGDDDAPATGVSSGGSVLGTGGV